MYFTDYSKFIASNVAIGREKSKNEETSILYECDKRACETCTPAYCHLTTDIRHAKNFQLDGYIFVEKRCEDRYVE